MVTSLRLQRLSSVRIFGQQDRRAVAVSQLAADAAEAERIFHQALHLAYRRFSRRHPEWVSRGFDDRFLRGPAARLLADASATGKSSRQRSTGMDLARQWDRHFGVLMTHPQRIQEQARLAAAASEFLGWFTAARDALVREEA